MFDYLPSLDPEIRQLQAEAAERLIKGLYGSGITERSIPIRSFGESETRPYQAYGSRYGHRYIGPKMLKAWEPLPVEVAVYKERQPVKQKTWDYHCTPSELFGESIVTAIQEVHGFEVDLSFMEPTAFNDNDFEWGK